MTSHLFFPSRKTIKTKTTSFIKPDYLLGLGDYQVWVGFADGTWVLYDAVKNETLQEGKFTGDLGQLNDLVHCPRALNNKQIVFGNCTNLKLEVLNVHDGTLDSTWTGDFPTQEALPSANRGDVSKLIDVLNDLKIEVLRTSQLVGVFERKEINESSTDYLLTVYEQGNKQRLTQVTCSSQQKQYNLGKANEDNLFVFWAPYHEGSFSFAIFDVRKANEGLKNINITMNIKTTIIACFPWTNGTVSFFGNADSSGVNEQYVYDQNREGEIRTIPMKYHPEGVDSLLTEVVATDPTGQKIILTEFADDHNVVLYDTRMGGAFIKKQEADSIYNLSFDRQFVVEYDGVLAADEDANKPGEAKINILRVVNKQLVVLFLMKYAKTHGGKNYLDFYGDPYIAKAVADMLM